jgi:hypothetical protein
MRDTIWISCSWVSTHSSVFQPSLTIPLSESFLAFITHICILIWPAVCRINISNFLKLRLVKIRKKTIIANFKCIMPGLHQRYCCSAAAAYHHQLCVALPPTPRTSIFPSMHQKTLSLASSRKRARNLDHSLTVPGVEDAPS